MKGFHYVYILESVERTERFYVGLTNDLASRLGRHNAGGVPHTAKFLPWRIKTAIAFRDRAKAVAFETYLKSASGRALAKSFGLQGRPARNDNGRSTDEAKIPLESQWYTRECSKRRALPPSSKIRILKHPLHSWPGWKLRRARGGETWLP